MNEIDDFITSEFTWAREAANGSPSQGHPGQARRGEPGELANVRLWLEADIHPHSNLRPLYPLKQT